MNLHHHPRAGESINVARKVAGVGALVAVVVALEWALVVGIVEAVRVR